ncbi:MAG TPA: sensor histidine kinase [Candidatus Dormibacteraeota bacterium]|nr:sensor histidine kinase [Candidatus Dormibacteraeota bacterium]
MSVTENETSLSSVDRPSALLDWIDGEMARLSARLPDLEQAAMKAVEELAEADVIRRHVILHPERFSPHERDAVVEKAQKVGEVRQRAEIEAESVRDRLQFCQAVAMALRSALAQDEADRQGAAGTPPEPLPGGALAIFQAVEAERLRIARDLHDGPAQVLADLVLKAEILDRIAQRTPEALPAELEEFRSLVRNAVADMRRFMFDLRPDSLDDLGLVATMKRFSSEYQDRTGITCRFNVSGEDRRVGSQLEEAIFRIIQEALNNVQKHSGAKTAEVVVTIQPGRVAARIRDDGSGFDPANPPRADGRQQLGLRGMRERAEALGGSMRVSSEAGRGTELEVEFPTEG